MEIRKFDPDEIFSVVYIEGETQKMYLKRFCIEKDEKPNTRTSFIGEHEGAKFLTFSTDVMPRLLLSYKVSDAGNSFPDDEVNVEEFIGIKSYKAKGKRLSNREIEGYQWLEPIEPEVSEVSELDDNQVVIENTDNQDVADDNGHIDDGQDPDNNPPGGGDGVQMELF